MNLSKIDNEKIFSHKNDDISEDELVESNPSCVEHTKDIDLTANINIDEDKDILSEEEIINYIPKKF